MALREWERALTASQPLALQTSSVLITASCFPTKRTSERQTSGKKCCSAPMHQWYQIACWIGIFLQAGSSENRQSPLCVDRKRVQATNYFHFPACSLLLFSFADTASKWSNTGKISPRIMDAVIPWKKSMCIIFLTLLFYFFTAVWAKWKAFGLKIKSLCFNLFQGKYNIYQCIYYLFVVHNTRKSLFWSYNWYRLFN